MSFYLQMTVHWQSLLLRSVAEQLHLMRLFHFKFVALPLRSLFDLC